MRIRRILIAGGILAAAYSAAGQDASGVKDYAFARDCNPYLFLSNSAFLDTFQGRIATMDLTGRKENGNLVSLNQSPDSYTVGAGTESFLRLSHKLTFFGKVRWQYFSGKEMGGQVLINPGYNPVNFLESTEDTKGIKKRETYNLRGGLSYKLGNRWAAGVALDYTSADQTKIKDPRFSNIWMDVGLNTGISFKAGARLMLGVSLKYRNTIETVKGGIFGTTDKQYFILTDKGSFFGTRSELAGDYNYLPDNTARPMSNNFIGGAFQFVFDNKFSSELWAQLRDGYYGRKSSTTAVFFEFGGLEAGYKGKILLPSGKNLHAFTLNAGIETLTNNENRFEYVTPTGKNTVVKYNGQDKVFNRTVLGGNLSYTWYKGTGGYKPKMAAGVSIEDNYRTQKTSLYPFYRIQDVNTYCADVFGQYNLASGSKLMFCLEAHALACGGAGVANKDGKEVEASSSTIRSFDNYLNRQFEFETAPRAGGEISFGCHWFVNSACVLYINVSDRYISLLSAPQYLEGVNRNTATITLGCNF